MEQRDHLVVYNTLLSELLTCELFQITETLVYTYQIYLIQQI